MFISVTFVIDSMENPNRYADIYNEYDSNQKKISILDSTLREGEQHPGVSFTNKQRIQIAWMLDYFGVDQIEISPVVSEDHKKAVRTIIKQGLSADIVSHGRALRSDIDVSLDCDAKWVAAYLGISEVHLRDKLRITQEEAIERAVDTVEYAKSHEKMCRAVTVDRISLPDTARFTIDGITRFTWMKIRFTITEAGWETGGYHLV